MDNTALFTLNEIRPVVTKKGWNGYGCEAIPDSILDNAVSVVRKLDVVPEVFPLATGGIQLEYDRDDGGYLEIEITDNPDIVKVFHIKSREELDEETFTLSVNKLNALVNDFLGGIHDR